MNGKRLSSAGSRSIGQKVQRKQERHYVCESKMLI